MLDSRRKREGLLCYDSFQEGEQHQRSRMCLPHTVNSVAHKMEQVQHDNMFAWSVKLNLISQSDKLV